MTLTFLVTSLVIVATPGTGALYTISAALSRGTRTGVVAAFGCTLGIVPHLLAAVTGAAALLQASGTAFQVLKVAGVAYLLWMAWHTWRDTSALVVEEPAAPGAPADVQPSRRAPSALRVVVSAVLVNLLNPKLTLFFFAFLPQFVPAGGSAGGPGAQLGTLLLLSGVFMLMTFVVFAGYGVGAAALRRHLVDRPVVVRRMRQLFAASFVGLGAKLATTSR